MYMERGVYPYFREIDSAQNTEVMMDGKKVLMFGSNSYMGLTYDKRIIDAAIAATQKYGTGCAGSRLLNGTLDIHIKLEKELAEFVGKDESLCFSTGFTVNEGVIPQLVGRGDYIICDDRDHASIVDGRRLSFATQLKYKHNDMDALEKELQKCEPDALKLIVVDSVFSMEGDLANLPEIVRLKKKYNASVYVDEAHAFGLRGSQGLGCCEEAGILPDIDLLVGTLGKAAASAGAFVICAQTIRDYLINHVRPFIFTTALPPFTVAWSLYIVHNLPQMSARRERLSCITKRVHQALATEQVKDISQSHIIPLLIGSSADAMLQADAMQRHGFYILPVRPPTVPEGTARLRLSLRADLTDEETERLIEEATATPQLHSYETASTRTNNS